MSGAIRKNRKFLDNADGKKPETYKPAGGKLTSHGASYHLSLLMYIFLKALKMEEDFSLGAEVGEAGKFDDIVFRYRKEVGSKRYNRLIQLKHKLDPEKSNIRLSSMLNPKSDFNLITYFKSFLEIKDNFSNECEEIRDLIIYTNTVFDLKDTWNVRTDKNEKVTFIMKDTFKEISDDEGVEVMDELLQSNLYCFRKDTEERGKWVKYLMDKSERKCSELENDVNQYLDKLSFAIQQPETERLEKTVSEELKVCVGNNSEEVISQFYMYINKWLADKKGIYLNRIDCLELIEELKVKYGRFMFGVDRPVLNFSGREDELKDLKKIFEDRKQRVVLYGLGGVGKTQLARKFAETHTESYSCVLWLKSESYEDIENSFQNLAFSRLRIKPKREDGKAKDMKTILEEIKEVLQNRSCLFIFDNIQNNFEGSTDGINLNDVLMKLPNDAALLMTSRRSDWGPFSKYQLKSLSVNDAAILIKTSLKYVTLEDVQVQNLAKEIQYYPLALQQAIAYINRKGEDAKRLGEVYSIDSYLEKFKVNYKKLLEHPVQDLNEDEYQKTTLTTWNMTMEVIRKDKKRGALSEQILQKISYFFPDGILISEIIQCFSDVAEKKVKSAILLLDDYSMVSLSNGQCSVHRLVQKVTTLRLKEKGEKELLDSLLRVCEDLDVRNVVSIWEHSAEHIDLIRKHSEMPKYVIYILMNMGKYADGYIYGKRLLQVMETILDPMDQSMNEVNFALARVTHNHGLYEESDKVLKQVYEGCCTNLGEEDRFTLRVRKEMVRVLFDLGRHEECRDISKEVSEKFEKKFGPEDRDSVMAKVHYSECLSSSGKLEESYKMIKEACDIYDRVLETQDSYSIYARVELAKVLMDLKRYDESSDILRTVWEWKKSNKGEEHPDTMTTRYLMGLLQMELCNYAESYEILESVYECQKRTMGEEHPGTLSARYYMGLLQMDLCNYTESHEILESVYECQKKTMGEEHPGTLVTRYYMGEVQFELRNYAESQEILECVYECQKRTLGEEHQNTLKTRQSMGEVLCMLGNYPESLKILECVCECRRRTLGEDHPETLDTKESMGTVLYMSCNYPESLKILKSVCECRRRTLGKEHPDTLRCRKLIGNVEKKLGSSVKST